MPTNYSDPGHVNDGTPNAEVVFDNFATNDGKLETNWSHDTATCSNSYCHGAFSFSKDASSNQFAYADSVIVGNNRDMIWNSVGSGQADCGTCHGLPPTGHAAYPACSTCHGSVVDANNNIIDKTKHINGQIDVF
jgi:predicted CxxxxCH...CXXCH cytochrome family protein